MEPSHAATEPRRPHSPRANLRRSLPSIRRERNAVAIAIAAACFRATAPRATQSSAPATVAERPRLAVLDLREASLRTNRLSVLWRSRFAYATVYIGQRRNHPLRRLNRDALRRTLQSPLARPGADRDGALLLLLLRRRRGGNAAGLLVKMQSRARPRRICSSISEAQSARRTCAIPGSSRAALLTALVSCMRAAGTNPRATPAETEPGRTLFATCVAADRSTSQPDTSFAASRRPKTEVCRNACGMISDVSSSSPSSSSAPLVRHSAAESGGRNNGCRGVGGQSCAPKPAHGHQRSAP